MLRGLLGAVSLGIGMLAGVFSADGSLRETPAGERVVIVRGVGDQGWVITWNQTDDAVVGAASHRTGGELPFCRYDLTRDGDRMAVHCRAAPCEEAPCRPATWQLARTGSRNAGLPSHPDEAEVDWPDALP